LRRKLGLITQLPIHGPGGKQVLEQHLKNAENEQVIHLLIYFNVKGKTFSLYSLHIQMPMEYSIIVY
jgi:hypothetical protein